MERWCPVAWTKKAPFRWEILPIRAFWKFWTIREHKLCSKASERENWSKVSASVANILSASQSHPSCFMVHQSHGTLDLRTQSDAGRVLRSSRGDRGRRAARLFHAADGRSRGDVMGASHLRTHGERLA